jgi:hypothetical protein
MTLLDQAKEIELKNPRRRNSINQEEIDLAVAWAKGEVRLAQVAQVLGIQSKNTKNAYSFLAKALGCYVRGQ